jgi:ribosomal protein L29
MKDIAKQDLKDLTTLLAEKREEVRTFRFGMAGGATRNTKAARTAKREIARIMTELTRRAKNTPSNTTTATTA